MKLKPKITIADHFPDLEDPRIERTKHHQLIDIIAFLRNMRYHVTDTHS
ncbi:hypothetical protein QUA43_29450 [Microcoleus sp. N9_B4]